MPPELKKEIDKILNIAIRERWRYSDLRAELNRLLNKYYTRASLRNAILRDTTNKQYFEWLKEHTLNKSENDRLNNLFSNLVDSYAKQKSGINADVKRIFELGIKNEWNADNIKTEMKSDLKAIGLKYSHYADTIVRTAQQSLSSMQTLIQAKEAGITKFEYAGASPERDFCRHHYGKIYTMQEINRISQSVGRDVFIMRGGFNCKHYWNPIV